MFVPGRPFTRRELTAILDKAIERRDADLALRTAHNLRPLDLCRALRLTVLLGEREAPRFQAAARRWLVRFIEERRPTVEQIKRAADALNELLTFIARDDARAALLNLADQIARSPSPSPADTGSRRAAR